MANENAKGFASNPTNVGILAMEVYTPSTYVTQESLETHYGVSKGKYTLGLGQEGMAVVCGDREDVNSLALTAFHSLLEKYDVDPSEIGRLEVGTETLVDKSKSTKTVLMELFHGGDGSAMDDDTDPYGDVEGATTVNACYGGTAALLSSMDWVLSSSLLSSTSSSSSSSSSHTAGTHHKPYAVVVAVDVAAYAAGPARPTCGAGAVAVLIGPNAPLVFDFATRSTHAEHVWDFFKPDPSVEYPVVDGKLSNMCYYRALDNCYNRFANKMDKATPKGDGDAPFDVTVPDYFVFHSPYNKLVQKSYARLFLADARRRKRRGTGNEDEDAVLAKWIDLPIQETYADRELDGVLKKLAAPTYAAKMSDSNHASQQVGNTYTASVFLGLASLVDRRAADMVDGTTVSVFSYGSGSIATMYALRAVTPSLSSGRFTLARMAEALSLTSRLADRRELLDDPAELDYALDTRAKMHCRSSTSPEYTPLYPTVGRMFPGTYYLTGIGPDWVRSYARVPLDATMSGGGPLVPAPAKALLEGETNDE